MTDISQDTTFVAHETKIVSTWLQRINDFVHTLCAGAETAAEMRTAIGLGTLATQNTVATADIDNNAVTLGKLATMATDSFLGRDTAGIGDPEVISAANARTILNVEDGATADQTDAEIETAYNNQVAAASQAEMEAGTETAIRRMTPQRVAQAIAALASVGDYTVLSKTANYTVLTTDMSDASGVIVDCDINTTGSVEITLPTAATMSGKKVHVVCSTDNGSTSSRYFSVKENGGTEIFKGFMTGDYVTVTSDGTNYIILDNKFTCYTILRLEADDAIAASSSEKIFDASVDAKVNIGGFWDGTTNHRYDVPFSCDIRITTFLVRTASSQYISLRKNGTEFHLHIGPYDGSFVKEGWVSGDYLEIYGQNDAGSTQSIQGNANEEETSVVIEIIKRYY